jgi:hypothetical protein
LKPEGKKLLRGHRRRFEDNIKVGKARGYDGMDPIHMAINNDQWSSPLKNCDDTSDIIKSINLLTSPVSISSSRRMNLVSWLVC